MKPWRTGEASIWRTGRWYPTSSATAVALEAVGAEVAVARTNAALNGLRAPRKRDLLRKQNFSFQFLKKIPIYNVKS